MWCKCQISAYSGMLSPHGTSYLFILETNTPKSLWPWPLTSDAPDPWPLYLQGQLELTPGGASGGGVRSVSESQIVGIISRTFRGHRLTQIFCSTSLPCQCCPFPTSTYPKYNILIISADYHKLFNNCKTHRNDSVLMIWCFNPMTSMDTVSHNLIHVKLLINNKLIN